MLRFVLAWLSLVLLTLTTSQAQGIRGVTRRTPTQEFQDPPRQFFNAAGINITGGAVRPVAPGAPAFAGQTAPIGTPSRPIARPMLSNKATPQRVQARPYVLGPAPTTNRSHFATTPPGRPLSRTALVPTQTRPPQPQTPRPPLGQTPVPSPLPRSTSLNSPARP